jgi:hypothetical protein
MAGQTSNQARAFGVWSLALLWSLDLGAWSLFLCSGQFLLRLSIFTVTRPSTNHIHHLMNYVWDAYQQGQIAEAKTDAIGAKMEAAQYSERVRSLETQVTHMALACQAMWELLRVRTGIGEQELLAKMNEVDQRDGRKDGRMSTVLTTCPACGKPSNSTHSSCRYCGAIIPRRHLFE